MADTSLVSRVGTIQLDRTSKVMVKNSKNRRKTTQRATSAVWRIFAELDKPKRIVSKMNLTSAQVNLF